VLEYDRDAKRWVFKKGLLDELIKAQFLNATVLQAPLGGPWTVEELAKVEKGFTPDHLAEAITLQHMQQLMWVVVNYSNAHKKEWFKDGTWTFPETILADAVQNRRLNASFLKDGWGEPIRLVRRDKKLPNQTGSSQFDFHELVSAGPDGKFDTADDIRQFKPNQWARANGYWFVADSQLRQLQAGRFAGRGGMTRTRRMLNENGALQFGAGGTALGRAPEGALVPLAAAPTERLAKREASEAKAVPGASEKGGAAPITRVREFFPETMLWRPALITDDKGRAELPLTFADSITTWRLSASASSVQGALGGVTAPLRVFQDFFVDIDLPVSLTQNDEVAFPVAVYNYLKRPQTVKLDLQPESWFELTDSGGPSRSLDLQPNEVTSVKFRIRAHRVGYQPLLVKASGTKMSDAIRRTVEVVPDGQRVEQVVTDQLARTVTHTITIPGHAVPDSSKLLVKVYPGVMSQVLEGTEGMLRLPGG
jgi:hypothetical protein